DQRAAAQHRGAAGEQDWPERVVGHGASPVGSCHYNAPRRAGAPQFTVRAAAKRKRAALSGGPPVEVQGDRNPSSASAQLSARGPRRLLQRPAAPAGRSPLAFHSTLDHLLPVVETSAQDGPRRAPIQAPGLKFRSFLPMLDILATIFPVFVLIALGYGAAKGKVISAEGGRGVDAYVYYFAIPALLFITMLNLELGEAAPWRLWGAYYLG